MESLVFSPKEVAEVLVAHLCAKRGLTRDQIQLVEFDVHPEGLVINGREPKPILHNVRITLADAAVVKTRKPRRPSKQEIAAFYNTETLPRKKLDFVSEFGRDPDPEEFFEVKPADLVVTRAWECSLSLTKFCVYEQNSGEDCIFCGQPKERQ